MVGLGAALALALLASGAAGSPSAAPEGGSTQQNPTVVFTSPGSQTVTLTVCNAQGQCSSKTQTVVVLDPHPAVTALTVTPPQVELGQSVLLDAAASGKPPLSFSWQVLHNGVVVAAVFGAHTTWSSAGAAPGPYSANLVVTNAYGSAGAAAVFTVTPAAAARFYTVPPCRLLDTRILHQPLAGSGPPRTIAVGGVCGVPPAARAVALNLTVVGPTEPGFVAVYPADLAHPTVSSLNFGAGAVRANNAVLPLSSDGTARLAAAATLSRPGSVDLLVDVSGYFATPPGGPPAALEFDARLCPFGFCEFAAGTAIFFSQAFGGAPSEYRYDWTGSGVFTERSPTPIKSHVYASAVGVVTPSVQVASGTSVSTLAGAPMFISSEMPQDLPPAPLVSAVTFAGEVSSSPIDPTITGPHPSYLLAIASPPPNLFGYNVYASKNGAPFQLAAALDPTLLASEPLVVEPFSPPGDSLRILVSAVSFAGEGPASGPISLTHP